MYESSVLTPGGVLDFLVSLRAALAMGVGCGTGGGTKGCWVGGVVVAERTASISGTLASFFMDAILSA